MLDNNYEELISKERLFPNRQFYMSFCNTNLPVGSQFLGALVIEAKGQVHAHEKATRLGLNPGGEIMFILIPEGKFVPLEWTEKLLTAEEAKNLPINNIEDTVCQQKEL